MSHFWAPSPLPAPPPSKPRLWRRWSELELLGTRGRYRVTPRDVEDSPPPRRSLASLCAGRRRSRHEDADPRAEAGARFRARSTPGTPAPEQLYHVTATLLTHRAADTAAAVLTFSHHTPTLLPPPQLRPVSTSNSRSVSYNSSDLPLILTISLKTVSGGGGKNIGWGRSKGTNSPPHPTN